MSKPLADPAYGFDTYAAAYSAGVILADFLTDTAFGIVQHGGRHLVELASRKTGKARETVICEPWEALARLDGWKPYRADGSLTAGVRRYPKGAAGFQWADGWREACAISADNRKKGRP